MSLLGFIGLAVAVLTFLAAAALLVCGALYRQPRQTMRLIVATRRDISEHLFTLTLRRSGLARLLPLPRFAAGQSVAVSIPNEAGSRRYSIARWQALPFAYELTIKREPAGRFSPRLAEHARARAILTVGSPEGRFTLPKQSSRRRAVLIAGGVGITPLMAILDQWAKTGRPYAEVHLYWQVRYEQEAPYCHVLAGLGGGSRKMRARILVSRPVKGTGERINAALLAGELGDLADTDFYLCAGSGLLDTLIADLADRGVAKELVHYERFGIAAASAVNEGWMVEFAGQRFDFAGHSSLLDAIESQELEIDSDCRTGSCGRCLVAIEKGEAHHRVSPDYEVPPGHVLACCAVPRSHLALRRH